MTTAYLPNGPQRTLLAIEILTLVLLAVGLALMFVLVRRVDLHVVLLLIAGGMIGVSTVASMRRRISGRPAPSPRRPLWFWTLVRLTPNLLLLVVAAGSILHG